MALPQPRSKSPIKLPRRLGLLLILAGVLLVLLWLGLKIGRAYDAARQGLAHLEALQTSLQGNPKDLLDDFAPFKAQVLGASEDMATLRAETAFLDPLLANLGWVPRYGPELAATPHLTAMAADLSGAGADLATVVEAVLPTLRGGGEDSLSQALLLLQQQQPLLKKAQARLQHAAYERTFLDPARLDDGPYARIGPLLEQLDQALPPLVRAMGLLDVFLPQADAVLGMDAPRRYIVVGQNNFELRATGGFMGSMGLATVDQGKITNLDYRRSYDWDNPNREKVQPPLPYVRYMRFGAWFIRDANFSPDFPTAAQTVEMFWQLDGHEPADGVIAVDLNAVQSLIEAIGPIEVPGYGVSVGGSHALETMWEQYRRDPGFLPTLTGAVAQRLQQPDVLKPDQLPALIAALGKSLEEKHILFYFNDADLQKAVARSGWGGALRDDAGDYLYVVDSDFSYAEVNPFIEEEIGYRVTLDSGLKVQESVVTLTYRNHFDLWSSAETRERFGGLCFNSETRDLDPIVGCYGDYVRLYVPRGSRFVSAEGFDDGMEYREEAGRTVIAGYVRVLPGEERTVSVTYVPQASLVDGQYRLTLQKQPGTDHLPLQVEVNVSGSASDEALVYTDLQIDRVITAMWQGGALALSGEGGLLAQLTPQRQAQQKAFAVGLAEWQAGRREEAISRWRQGEATELVLERVNLLLARQSWDEAEALCQAALELAPESAQAYFLLGKVRQGRGDMDGALESLNQAARLDPGNLAVQQELGLLYESLGDTESAYQHLQYVEQGDVVSTLWQRTWAHFNAGQDQAGLEALRLLIRLVPDNVEYRFTLAVQLQRLKQYDQALAAYEEFHLLAPQDVRFYVQRGQVYVQQNLPDQAIADLEEAVQVAPLDAYAWYLLGSARWDLRQDKDGALAALEQAAALVPIIHYFTKLGSVYLVTGDLAAAATAYEHAVTLPGYSANTWWNLGYIYQRQERWDKAIGAYGEAVALEPGNAWNHAGLAYAYEKADRKVEAIAEYEAALALQPGQVEWEQALARLKQ